nr:immunoglobulin heavy chain junction region [Mus musculus]MBK4185229.1 immunoglobulin heavy chain junction region [Mus musculus]MBK4185230.1 immunoglobulin heavy chain junction region [Mus musculus]MBK4185231.1 immunoglobulin heavy chain junction region [Mus musculus]
CASEDGNYDYW